MTEFSSQVLPDLQPAREPGLVLQVGGPHEQEQQRAPRQPWQLYQPGAQVHQGQLWVSR